MSGLVAPARVVPLLAVLALAIAFVAPAPAGVPPATMHAGALAFFTIGLWATGAMPEHVTALVFMTLAVLLKVAPPGVAFAGFEATAMWLVFGGIIIGTVMQRTGLGERLAVAILPLFGASYTRALAGVAVVGVALAFVMPSTMGRIVLLMPIILALADRMGFVEGRPGRTGMAVTLAVTSFMVPCTILPANVPNMVLVGAAESLHGVTLTYGQYLKLHFPVTGLLKAVCIVAAARIAFPDRPVPPAPLPPRGPMSADERKLALLLAVALGFWVTDFLHGINAGWIGLAAGVICLLPGVNLLPPPAFAREVNFSSTLYVAGILGLGTMVAQSGVGALVSGGLLSILPLQPGADFTNFLSLTASSALLALATTFPGVPAVMTPLAPDLAAASGLPLLTVMMTQVVGFSTVILPYQAPPIVLALQLARVRMGQAARVTLLVLVPTVLVLVPLAYLWWRLLGYFP
ncbi:SLC13 family permease [Stella sp.]|uniref:SLC13 family permease n=1 Tax=Stella sp. TaxID=2912054 RepID=UPI0035B46E31